MKENNNIEEIFREVLSSHETPVDPSVWANVSHSIGGASAVSSGAAASGLAKLGTVKIVSIVAGIAAITTGIVVSLPDADESLEAKNNEVKTEIVEENFSSETEPSESNETEEDTFIVLETDQETESEPTNLESDHMKDVLEIDHIVEEVQMDVIDQKEDVVDEKEAEKEVEEEKDQPTYSELRASFGHKKVSNYDDLIYRFEAVFQKDALFSWEIENEIVSTDREFEYEFYDSGDYEVTLRVERNEEVDESTLTIKAYGDPEITIADIFTPNGDLYNDEFDIMAQARNLSLLEFNILDVQHQEVFVGDSENHVWNGKNLQGDDCPDGNYLWVAKFKAANGEFISKMGHVYLKRN